MSRPFVTSSARFPSLAAALTAAALALTLAACKTAPAPKPDFHVRPDTPPGVYYPLDTGHTWGYQLEDLLTGDHGLLVNRVIRMDGSHAVFYDAPDPLAYEDRGTEIVRLPSGAIVLQGPLAVGTSWAIPDGTARITAVDAAVVTPSGSYHCVVVEELTTERRVVTSYAPKVGPVAVEISLRSTDGERLVNRALLRSFRKGSDPMF